MPNQDDPNLTHFGFEEVPTEQKASRVADVFHSVASRYDLMNDLMSGGIHRIWKAITIESSGARRGQSILDIAGGTGDLAYAFAKIVGAEGRVVLADINASMLQVGRDKLHDRGMGGKIEYVQADAETLPFYDNSFDCVTISFGLRNVTHKENAIQSMLRVLKPGGRLLILEFSTPVAPGLAKIYDLYSFKVLPKIGAAVTGDEDSYRYLAESIRKHPDQQTLANMMSEAGFEQVRFDNLSGGIVALHIGFKPFS